MGVKPNGEEGRWRREKVCVEVLVGQRSSWVAELLLNPAGGELLVAGGGDYFWL